MMAEETLIRLALPSKGRMESESMDFLAGCGLRVDKSNPRQYTATIPALPQVRVFFQRARDIPTSIAAGDVDLGITGYDNLHEMAPDGSPEVYVIHEALGYGGCSLVLAVPNGWEDVTDMAGLRARAARQPEGQPLRVATKFRAGVTRFLEKHNVENVRVVGADGALESAPIVGYADFIADITSSGTTLRENHLRPLEDGTIVESQAVFLGNRAALENRPEVLAVAGHMLEFIEAHLRAVQKYMIFANLRGSHFDELRRQVFSQPDLGGLQGPTVSPMLTQRGDGWWAINLVARADRLHPVIQQLRAIGGSGVVVTPVTYIFDEAPERYQRLMAEVGAEAADAAGGASNDAPSVAGEQRV